MTAEGDSIIVADGTIKIAKDGDNYSIAAALMDENEQIHSYSYVGPVAVEDRAIGLQVGSVSYLADYNTYFANDNSEWDFGFYVTEPLSESMPYFYSFGIDIFEGKGVVDPQAIPTGVFTITSKRDTLDLPYKTGTIKVENGKGFGGSGYADYDPETGDYKDTYVKEGTMEIVKDSEYYTFKFDLVICVVEGHYDDDWNWIVDSETPYSWAYTFEDVMMPEVYDGQSRPQPDVDMEFKGNVYPSSAYIGFWYGDSYGLGGNVFYFGWSTGIENWYSMQFPVHSSTPWVYEKNWNNRYCSTPVPDGTYTYVVNKPTENSDFIPNLANEKKRFLIKNGYTGSSVDIDKGGVKIEGDKIYVDAEGQLTYADGTVSEQRIKFSGWLPNQCYYHRDYSKATYQTQVAWAE